MSRPKTVTVKMKVCRKKEKKSLRQILTVKLGLDNLVEKA